MFKQNEKVLLSSHHSTVIFFPKTKTIICLIFLNLTQNDFFYSTTDLLLITSWGIEWPWIFPKGSELSSLCKTPSYPSPFRCLYLLHRKRIPSIVATAINNGITVAIPAKMSVWTSVKPTGQKKIKYKKVTLAVWLMSISLLASSRVYIVNI